MSAAINWHVSFVFSFYCYQTQDERIVLSVIRNLCVFGWAGLEQTVRETEAVLQVKKLKQLVSTTTP